MTVESPLTPTLTSLWALALLLDTSCCVCVCLSAFVFVLENLVDLKHTHARAWQICLNAIFTGKMQTKTAAIRRGARSAVASYPLSLQRDVAKVIKEGCSRARWPLLWPEAVWRDKWLTQPGVRLGLMPLSAPLLSQWFSQISDRVCYLVTGMRATACRHREGQSMRTIFVGLNEKKDLTKKNKKQLLGLWDKISQITSL